MSDQEQDVVEEIKHIDVKLSEELLSTLLQVLGPDVVVRLAKGVDRKALKPHHSTEIASAIILMCLPNLDWEQIQDFIQKYEEDRIAGEPIEATEVSAEKLAEEAKGL